MARDPVFTVDDLRGGVNTTDSPTLLKPNQVVAAVNVDYRDGALGAKRRGTTAIDLTGAAFNSSIAALFRHTPSNSIGNDELWGIDENGNVDRRVGGSWQGGVPVVNNFITIGISNFDANAVSLHGKLFIAARGTENRLLCWDGTVLRWAGLAQPPDPTVGNTGSGSYSGSRYFRIRYVEQRSGVVVRRSEPTNTIAFVPSGSGSGALVTKPAGTEAATSIYSEGQTHWEVEASLDNILFYRIATVVIGTATYTDTTAFATGYASFPLSETIGEYLVPGAARHVAVDEDRLVFAGSHFEPGEDATVWWTPVAADDGVGNDERTPIETSQFLRFDGLDGGRVTGLVPGIAGNIYVFKLRRIYKMVRTGIAGAAYQPVTESYGRGATMRGAAAGSDQAGVPCVYFTDPSLALCRIGQRGVEDLARSVRDTWAINPESAVGPRVLYYPELDQVWFTSPVLTGDPVYSSTGEQVMSAEGDPVLCSATAPERLIVYDTKYGGFTFFDGVPGSAYALTLFYDNQNLLKPVIGGAVVSVGGGGTSSVHFADSDTTDSGTAYLAYIKTKPYVLGNLWTKFGLMAAVLLARAASSTLTVKLIRNLGIEEKSVTVNLAAAGSENHVIKPLDAASMSELNTVQVEIGDPTASSQGWSLDQIVFRIREEEGSA